MSNREKELSEISTLIEKFPKISRMVRRPS